MRGISNSNKIKIQLFVREDCPSCKEVEIALREYCNSNQFVIFEVLDLQEGYLSPHGKSVYITPAIWVNDKLWSCGGFDISRFDERMNRLIKTFGYQ